MPLSSHANLADSTAKYQLSIDARRLNQALIQFSHQSGMSILAPDQLTTGLFAPALEGEFDLASGLDTLLTDSGLAWELIDNRIVAIVEQRCLADRSGPGCRSTEQLLQRYPVYAPGLEETYVYGQQVTGSRIPRAHYQGSAPVDLIGAPGIELSGAQTLGELLRFVPAVTGNSLSTAIANGGDGTASVTLRGLPASNTLVLINGRRVANDGLAGESVDLNSIAPAAVERVEILKDGASAIYGSDAVAGVVNIIMKRDFHGFLAEAFYGRAEAGDLPTETVTLQYGTGLPQGSFFISATHYEQQPIFSRDRLVSANADGRDQDGADLRSSATPDSRIMLPDGSVLIAEPGGFRPATDDDLYNFQSETTAVVPLRRQSLYSNISYDFSEQITASLEAGYTETRAIATLAPTPIFTAFEQTPLIVAADNPFNTFGTELADVRRRLLELPPRRQRNRSEVARVTALVEGLFHNWNWDLGYSWSRSQAEEQTSALVDAARLQAGIGPASGCRGVDIDGCVPINLLGTSGSLTPEQADFISTEGEVNGYFTLSSLTFNAGSTVALLPAGDARFSAGFEYRREATRTRPSRNLVAAQTIGGSNFTATEGARDVSELYLETVVPTWKSANGFATLDIEAALRLSHYSDLGSTTKPRIAARLQLSPAVLLRANYADSFRAPSLNELYQGARESQAFIADPCTVVANVGVLPGCSQLADPTRNQFLTLTGGNPELRAETADNYGLGVVWTPAFLTGFSASVDYFRIDQSNVVGSSSQFIVDRNAQDGSFAGQVSRDAEGNLTLVTATNLNAGERRVSGADVKLSYTLQQRTFGQFNLSLSGTYIDTYRAQLDPGTDAVDFAGSFVDQASDGFGGLPQWKSQFSLRWARQRWRGSYEMHYADSMRETVPGTSRRRDIDAMAVHDLQVSYTFDQASGLRWSLGVDNLLDTEAPFAASAFNDNIDGRTHELKGRFWYTKLSQRF